MGMTRMPGLMQHLTIVEGEAQGLPTLELQGSVDIQSKELLRDHLNRLLADGHQKIRVDLAGIDYLGSVGLAVLIEVSKRMRKRGGQLLIAPGPKELRKHLALLNLHQVLDFEEPLV